MVTVSLVMIGLFVLALVVYPKMRNKWTKAAIFPLVLYAVIVVLYPPSRCYVNPTVTSENREMCVLFSSENGLDYNGPDTVGEKMDLYRRALR